MDQNTQVFAGRAGRKSLAGPSSRGHQDQRESRVHCGAAARWTRRADCLRHIDGGTPPRFEPQLRSEPDESFRAADAVVERHS